MRRAAATLNACNSWPQVHTWHSEDSTFEELVRKRISTDFHYVVHRGATVGANDPRTFTVFLDVDKIRALHLRSREAGIMEAKERERIKFEKEKEDEIRHRVEENKRRKREAEKERLLLQEELNEKRLKREKRLRGSTPRKVVLVRVQDWKRRVNDPTTVSMGISGPWKAFLFLIALQSK